MTEQLPENPAERKILVVLDEDDYRSLEYDDEGRELLVNPEVHIQKFPVSGSDKTLQAMQREGLLRPGAMLLQSPHKGDVYADLSDAEDSFAVQKYTLFSTVCMTLGATEVCIDRIVCRDEQGETEVDVGISRPGGRGGVDFEHERIASLQSKISLLDKFKGGEPNVEAAEELLRETGLMNEPNLRSLLEMSRVGTNRIESREFHLDLTREVRRRLEIAAGLEIPAALGGALDVEHRSKEEVQYSVDVWVKF